MTVGEFIKQLRAYPDNFPVYVIVLDKQNNEHWADEFGLLNAYGKIVINGIQK